MSEEEQREKFMAEVLALANTAAELSPAVSVILMTLRAAMEDPNDLLLLYECCVLFSKNRLIIRGINPDTGEKL